jgi:uncharacterized protein (DUF2141 family)
LAIVQRHSSPLLGSSSLKSVIGRHLIAFVIHLRKMATNKNGSCTRNKQGDHKMKQIAIIFSLITLMVLTTGQTIVAGQANIPTTDLVIHIKGFETSQGMAKVGIVNSRTGYESGDTSFMGFNYKIINNEVVRTITLPYGEYAIKVFHDENGNDELDTLMFGIPAEPYGFSNNARGKLGPPEYEEARFTLESPEKKITINIR